MNLLTNKKAVSTFILIILMLCSIVFGVLVSYLWVMGNYYNMPEDTTLLIVTNAVFPGPPAIDLTYFNVTILNLSNSISDVNITAVRLSVEGKNEVYNITATDPEPLPFLLRRGTEHTFKCKKNWSNFAGETVRIEPAAANTSTKSYLYTTPRVKLKLIPNFDETKSVEYFNLIIENSESIINITLSEIMLFGESINKNITPSLPYVLPPNQNQIFRCDWNWENLRKQNVTITVKSSEGYEIVYTTNELLGATLSIQEVKFDYRDVTYFNLTISNSEDSTASATINRINLTLQDGTKVVINETFPPIRVPSAFNLIPSNQSRTFKCFWNWTQYRNETLIVDAYTLEGFTIPSNTTKTPPAVVWNITDVKFDFDDLDHFFVNVTNMPCSLREINITKIILDNNETVIDPPVTIHPGKQEAINCTFPWKDWINETVTITALTDQGLNVSRIVPIPPVGLKLLGGDNFPHGDLDDLYEQTLNITIPINITIPRPPYVNITISNSVFSLQNVNITKIIIETGNGTYEINNNLAYEAKNCTKLASGYILGIGQNVTFICIWDYTPIGPTIKVTVYTAEGFQVSRTWYK
jgi:hypothetical protein